MTKSNNDPFVELPNTEYSIIESDNVALVDLDGCAIKKDKTLNMQLMEMLRNGNYKEVIFFTQRSKYIQNINLSKQLSEGSIPNENTIVTTSDAVKAVERALGNDIIVKVSTSVDVAFGEPLKYFSQMVSFEKNQSRGLIRDRTGENRNSSENSELLKQEIENESAVVKRYFDPENKERDPLRFYPVDKKIQYTKLYDHLKETYPNLRMHYFDDHYLNQKEIIDDNSIERRPNCFVVTGEEIKPLSDYQNDLDTIKKIVDASNEQNKTDFLSEISEINKALDKSIPTPPKHLEYITNTLLGQSSKFVSAVIKTLKEEPVNAPVAEQIMKQIKSQLNYAHVSFGDKSRNHKDGLEATLSQNSSVRMKNNLKDLKGDALKTRILINFQLKTNNIINKGQSSEERKEELKEYINQFKTSDEYKILASAQGAFTRGAHKLGLDSVIKTDSIKAFEKIVEQANKNMDTQCQEEQGSVLNKK